MDCLHLDIIFTGYKNMDSKQLSQCLNHYDDTSFIIFTMSGFPQHHTTPSSSWSTCIWGVFLI